jgi:ribonuclease HI
MAIRRSWSPPTTSLPKININGAFIPSTKMGGWGYVIRDHLGDTVLAGVSKLVEVHDPLMVETIAYWKAVEAALANGIPKVQMETYSMLL